MNKKDRLLTMAQVSQILNVSRKTLYMWKWQEKNLPFLKIGGALRVSEKDLMDFIQKGKNFPSKD